MVCFNYILYDKVEKEYFLIIVLVFRGRVWWENYVRKIKLSVFYVGEVCDKYLE